MRQKLTQTLLLSVLLGTSVSSSAETQDVASLQAQIDALTARVLQLESRLDQLTTPEVISAVEELSGAQNPGDSQDPLNWRLLRVGHDYSDVRELLGPPLKIKKGGMEFWYYSDKGLKGPYVKFLFKKANDWKSPAELAHQ